MEKVKAGSYRQQSAVIALAAVFIILGSALLANWLSELLRWTEPGLGAFGWVGLALNGGLVAFIWLSGVRKHRDLIEPIYFMSVLFLLVFVLRPIQILAQYDSRVPFLPNKPDILQQALLLGALGNFCFYVGYHSKLGAQLGRKLPKFRMQWQKKRIVILAIIFSLLGSASYIYAITRSGGFDEFVNALQGRSLLTQSSSQIFAALLVLVNVATAILGVYYFKVKKLGLLFFASLALSTGLGVLQGGRAGVLLYWLALFVMYYCLRSPRRAHAMRDLFLAGVFAVVTVVIAVILGTLRQGLERGSDVDLLGLATGGALSIATEVGNRFLTEFCQFDWFAIIIDKTPSVFPYQYGTTFLNFFLQFVPRLAWPEKPLPIEYTVTTLLTGVESGSPFTIVGELYLNFLWPGIVLGMFIFGLLVRSTYAYLKYNPGNPAVTLLYGYILAHLFHLYTRSFAPMMFFMVLFIVPAVFAIRWIEVKK